MKKRALALVLAVIGVLAYAEDAAKEGSAPVVGAGQAQPKASESAASAKDLLEDLTDDTVFISINGRDELTWGVLRQHIDATIGASLGSLLAPAQDPMNDMRLGVYAKGVSRIVRAYMGAALIKQEAQKLGLTVPDEEFAVEAEKLRKLDRDSGPFQYLFMTNAVYQRAYAEKFMRPSITIPDERVEALVKARHETNLSVPLTNELFRAQLEELRGRLIRHEIDWSEAAEEFSECTDCSSDGGDCGTWEEDEDLDDRPPNLLKTVFSIPTNTVSEVVETPTAFHIVKVTSRYEPTAKAREEDGEVTTAEVRHIQLDKWEIEPEYTPETARKTLVGRELSGALKKKQMDLMKDAKIDCVVPLFRDKNSKARAPIIAPRR